MSLLRPAGDVWISSSWADHKHRKPPSSEPGTDYASAYGTVIVAADSGRVADLKTSDGGATGRYLTIDMDNGKRTRYLHLAEIWVGVGQRVNRGDQVGLTGASANGSDWGVGAHVHVTLFPGHSYDFDNTLDIEEYIGETPPPPPPPRGEEDMSSVPSLFHLVMSDGNQAYIAQQPTTQIIIGGDYKAALEKGYGIPTRQVNEHDWNAITSIWAAELNALNPGNSTQGLTVERVREELARRADPL